MVSSWLCHDPSQYFFILFFIIILFFSRYAGEKNVAAIPFAATPIATILIYATHFVAI
jgi:hypothetical protein